MKTIDDFNFKGRKVLIRVDFNVPLNSNFEVTDHTRIKAAVPTIKKILGDGGAVIMKALQENWHYLLNIHYWYFTNNSKIDVIKKPKYSII